MNRPFPRPISCWVLPPLTLQGLAPPERALLTAGRGVGGVGKCLVAWGVPSPFLSPLSVLLGKPENIRRLLFSSPPPLVCASLVPSSLFSPFCPVGPRLIGGPDSVRCTQQMPAADVFSEFTNDAHHGQISQTWDTLRVAILSLPTPRLLPQKQKFHFLSHRDTQPPCLFLPTPPSSRKRKWCQLRE